MKSAEKRKYERSEVFLLVKFRPYHKKVDFSNGVTSNMSSDGFNLEFLDAPIDSGEILEITLKHPHNSLSCSLLGKVVWIRQAWYKYMMGIKFVEIDEENTHKKSLIISACVPGYVEPSRQEEDTVNEPERVQAENPGMKSCPGKIDDLMMRAPDRYDEDISLEVSEHEEAPSIKRKAYLERNAGYVEETHCPEAGIEQEIITEQPHDLQAGEISNKVRESEISLLNREKEKSRKRSARLALVIPVLVAGVLAIVLAVPSGNINKGSGNLIPSHPESASGKKFYDKQNEIPSGDIQDIVVRVNAVDKSEELHPALPASYNDFGYMYDLEPAAGSGKTAKTDPVINTVVPETRAATDDNEILKSGSEDRKEKPAGPGSHGYIKKTSAADVTETGIDKPHAEQSVQREPVNEIKQIAETNDVTESAAAEESANASMTKGRKIIWSTEHQHEKTEPIAETEWGIKAEEPASLEKPAAAAVINEAVTKSLPATAEEETPTASVEEFSGTSPASPDEGKSGMAEEGLTAVPDESSEAELSESRVLSGKTAPPVIKEDENREIESLRYKEKQSEAVKSHMSRRIPNISLVVTGEAPKKP